MKNEKSTPSPINIRALLAAYRKWWIWVLVSIFLFGALGVYKILTSVPKSIVSSQIFISTEGGPSFGRMSDMADMMGLSSSSFGSNRSVYDEMQILGSHSLMLGIAKEFETNVNYELKKKLKKIPVYTKQPIIIEFDKSISDTLSRALKFDVKLNAHGMADIDVSTYRGRLCKSSDQTLPATITTPYGDFTITAGPGYIAGKNINEIITVTSYDDAATALQRAIKISQPNKKTDIIVLTYATSEAEHGKQLLDSIMSAYNKVTVEQQQRHLQFILEFINSRIASLSSELNIAEEGVEEFLARRDLVSPEAQASMFINQNARQEQELIKAENDHEMLRLAIEFLSTETNNSSLLPIMPSIASLTPLIEGYNELILERITIEPSAKGDNAALKAINIRIEAVKKNLMTALEKHYDMAKVQIEDLRRQFAESKAKLETVPNMEREYVNIKRQQSLKEQLYIFLLQKREETQLNIAGSQPMGIIIDPAYVVKSDSGSASKILLLLLLIFGAIFPAFIILLKWKINGKVNTIDNARTLLGVEPIAELPILPALDTTVVVTDPLSTVAQRYRLLRSNLLSTRDTGDCTVVALCSTTPKRDKSATVAANLAASLCGIGKKVALVDANLFNPGVAEVLDIPAEGILNSIINGDEATPRVCNLADGYTPLDVLTSAPDPVRASDAVASENFSLLVKKLRDTHDFIIITLPATDNFDALEAGTLHADVVIADITLGSTTIKNAGKLTSVTTVEGKTVYFVSLVKQK